MGDRTVVLTRAPEDNAVLMAELRAAGAEVLELPCVSTQPLDDPSGLRAALADLTSDDVIVVTSRAGADAVASAHAAPSVAAVGGATAARARAAGLRVTFVPSRADGATLGAELPLPRGMVVLARSDRADGELPRILRSRGARVREVTAYRTVAGVRGDPAAARAALERRAAVLLASPSAVTALCEAIGFDLLRRGRLVAIGTRTADRIRELVGTEPLLARSPAIADLLDAIHPREVEVT